MSLSLFLGTWLAWIIPATIQLALLVAFITPVAYLLRKISAHVRYLLWLLVIAKAFLLPEISAPWAVGRWGMPAALDGSLAVVYLFADPMIGTRDMLLPAEDIGVRSTMLPIRSIPPADGTPLAVAVVLFTAWALGAAVMMAIIARGQWALRAELKRARVLRDGPIYDLLTRLARELRVGVVPRLLLSPDALTPYLCGTWRPTIVLPASLPGNLSTAELRAVLAHELVHARRCDPIMCWLQLVALTLFWFHPLVWFANTMLESERELAVDESVVGRGVSQALSYARALLRVVEESSGRASFAAVGFLGGALAPVDLEARIGRLFSMPRRAGSSSLGALLTVGLFAMVMLPMGRAAEARPPADLASATTPLRR